MFKYNGNLILKDKENIDDNFTYEILDGMIDWVRVVDKNGVIIYTNKKMVEEIGRDMVGEKCYSVLGRGCPCKRCITETTISTGLVSEKEEVVGDRVFSVKSSPVKNSKGEIYAAVEVFRDVTRERKLEKELINKNKKMVRDLHFAKKLQEKLLPSKGKYGFVKIDYLYKPSEMLSGDMFDVFFIDENNIGVYMCDVVGHGVTASMMTMFASQTLKTLKDYVLNPGKVLTQLHSKFLDLNLDDDQYLTIFYGVFNRKKNEFVYVNGGHNSIPILRSKNDIKMLEAKGYPISCIFDNVEYEEKSVKLQKGDKILFYTDGIIEGKNKYNEEFGVRRLINVMEEFEDGIVKFIEKKIEEFKFSEQKDDFAVLLLEYM